MSISALSSNAYWLSNRSIISEKQQVTGDSTSAATTTSSRVSATVLLSAAATSAGKNVPTSESLLAAQEVDATDKQTWFESVIAQFNAEAEAKRKATEARGDIVLPSIDIEKAIAEGRVTSLWEPTIGEEPVPVPEEVDGVETGFLNSRYLSMAYLSKAEDLVENHPDVAAQVFNLDDPMHRAALKYIDRYDFDASVDASAYQDELGQQYYDEGQKLKGTPAVSAAGTKTVFLIDPEVVSLSSNPFVDRVSESARVITEQMQNIERAQTQIAGADTQSPNPARSKELAADAITASQLAIKDALQDLRNLENFDISMQSTEALFATLFSKQSGQNATLAELYEKYDVTGSQSFQSNFANSGMGKFITNMLESQAPIREKYGV